ncbi:MAG: 2-hydroxy-3-oxopropionate reductase [Defluviitaleaceae bacterium]|nr:2-hydroxy-3-oxopropionate reductase [Defluviitaleaceae bacterium]
MATKIGFIGLGIMGKPMVKNLLKAGHEVYAYDIVQEYIEDVTRAGAVACSSVAEIASNCSLIVTMLPNGPDVKDVVCGKDGLLEHLSAGSTIIDMSSIEPIVAQEIYATCVAKSVYMLDAPVSGGEPKAIDGTLSIMVGGDATVFNSVKHILLDMGASVVHCGDIGAGNTAKLANQIIVALNIAAVSEAFMLSTRAGVNPSLVFDAIKGGLAGSTVMNAKVPMILDGNFNPGFKVDLHIKDLLNALNTGHNVGAPLPLTVAIMEILQNVRAHGMGQNDHSAIATYYERLTGTEIRD